VGIIEQAARRLEELRRSGIEVPERSVPIGATATGAEANLPARMARRVEESRRPVSTPRDHTEQPGTRKTPPHAAEASQSARVEIDLVRLDAMGFVTPESPRSQIADEFRIIKRQLLASIDDDKKETASNSANLIMVTSAVPAEGKTFVAINLAISLAMEFNKHVLLVDADVSRPSVMRTLGIIQTDGFLDALSSPGRDLSSLLLRTNIDTLTVLPSGTPRPLATEMLASERASLLLAEMAERYPDRIIVFDAPPLLPSTESRVLATRMGQIILVVEAERTPQKSVMQALAAVEDCPVVLPLLNKATHSEVGSYYGYYGPMER
jgi:protein-tyrosine kinase